MSNKIPWYTCSPNTPMTRSQVDRMAPMTFFVAASRMRSHGWSKRFVIKRLWIKGSEAMKRHHFNDYLRHCK